MITIMHVTGKISFSLTHTDRISGAFECRGIKVRESWDVVCDMIWFPCVPGWASSPASVPPSSASIALPFLVTWRIGLTSAPRARVSPVWPRFSPLGACNAQSFHSVTRTLQTIHVNEMEIGINRLPSAELSCAATPAPASRWDRED